MPDAPSVVVVGSINVDHVVTAPCFPRPGETILGTSMTSSVGGKGANQAVAAALAGARVAMVANTGDDDDGAVARRRLAERGVQTEHVAVLATEVTGTAWITVAENDNTIIVIPGANALWSYDGLPSCVGAASVVLSQLEIPMDIVRSAAENARGHFVLNAAPATEVPDDVLALCDVVVVNDRNSSSSRVSTPQRMKRTSPLPMGACGNVVCGQSSPPAEPRVPWSPMGMVIRPCLVRRRQTSSTPPAQATRSREYWPHDWVQASHWCEPLAGESWPALLPCSPQAPRTPIQISARCALLPRRQTHEAERHNSRRAGPAYRRPAAHRDVRHL
jgi:hypothetical protein